MLRASERPDVGQEEEPLNQERVYVASNKELWDGWAKLHLESPELYDIEGFRLGKTTLEKVESTELGDIRGQSLLHLQCHFGLDTLSLARDKGAIVTGVDLSSNAIETAKQLSRECNIPAEFVCSDIYELPKHLEGQFDIVYTSHGVLTWLYDLNKWADIVAHYLKPGGTFYIVEFHPFTHMFNEEWTSFSEPYFYNGEHIETEEQGSYGDRSADFSHTAHEWPHTLSEIQNALRDAGLIVEFCHEFPYVTSECFPNLEQTGEGEYTVKDRSKGMPLMFSIKATSMPELSLKKKIMPGLKEPAENEKLKKEIEILKRQLQQQKNETGISAGSSTSYSQEADTTQRGLNSILFSSTIPPNKANDTASAQASPTSLRRTQSFSSVPNT